ncbi:hypothetical protein [Streptomyces bobili]|uniref:hypothetical protein n=1 Tax=Streptomyces bobili TaxID=67280 RepID=UPI00380D668F
MDALVFTDPTADSEQDADAGAETVDGDGDGSDEEDDVESVLSDIKSHPGNVSLNSLLDEISKLKQVRAVGVPEKVFTGIGVQVINAWRARRRPPLRATCGASTIPYGTSCSPPCSSSASGRSPTRWWSC